MAFHLAFTGFVADFCVEKQNSERSADYTKQFIAVAATVIHIQLVRQTVNGNDLLENLLEILGIVIAEQFTACQKP